MLYQSILQKVSNVERRIHFEKESARWKGLVLILYQFKQFLARFSLQLSLVNLRKTDARKFEPTMLFPIIEVCKIQGGMEAIPFISKIFNTLKSLSGNLMDACTTIGQIKVYNVSLVNSTLTRLWPSGDFITNLRFFDDIDDNIVNLTYWSKITH